MNRHLFLLSFIFCYAAVSPVFAQTFWVEIMVDSARVSGYDGDGFGPRIRIYRDSWMDDNFHAIFMQSNCIKGSIGNGSFNIGQSYKMSISNPELRIVVVTHEEKARGGDDCRKGGPEDAFEAGVIVDLDLNLFSPGVFSDVQSATTTGFGISSNYSIGTATVTTYFRIRYTPVELDRPNGNEEQNCSHELYTLKVKNLNTNATNTTGLKYQWQYSKETTSDPNYVPCMKNCLDAKLLCFLTNGWDCELNATTCENECAYDYPQNVAKWVDIGITDSDSIVINPLLDVFEGILANVASVHFRVRPMSSEGLTNVYSELLTASFLPPPPTASSITVEPSCSESSTGVIHISGITSQNGSVFFMLKRTTNWVRCTPPNCLDPNDISGSISGTTFDILNVEAGDYTLVLTGDGSQGFCPRNLGVITVPKIPPTKINNFSITNLTCHAVNDGSFSVSVSGGRSTSVSHELLNATTNIFDTKNSSDPNPSVNFSLLSPGNYQYTVYDGCTAPVTQLFEITQPVKVMIDKIEVTDATCLDPGDGSIELEITKSSGQFDRSAQSSFQYKISKNGSALDDDHLAQLNYTWNDLTPEKFTVTVSESGALACNGDTQVVDVGTPEPLEFKTMSITPVSCFGGNDGKIEVTGSGGNGDYLFEISGDAALTDTVGVFNSLSAGNFNIAIRNNNTCNDQFTQIVTITQPTPLVVMVLAENISCYGLNDGELVAIVSGGVPSYDYVWEAQFGSFWNALPDQSPHLTNQQEGTFRLRAKDANGCTTFSEPVAILDPLPLGVSDINVSDIRCFGEKGFIDVKGNGGTGVSAFEYTVGNSSTHNSFDATTPLAAGKYYVQVKDANGCVFKYMPPVVITSPPSALSFSEALSDFNGFNISCFGGSNGFATISAAGGNGTGYSGYEFAVDQNPFSTNPMVEGVTAGSHTISVRDGRGCVVSKNIIFTETLDQLFSVLKHKKDVLCFGDATGELEFTGSGGVAPYTFQLDQLPFQSTARFTDLPAAVYLVTVKDKNGCTNQTSVTVDAVNPKISIDLLSKDVKCFGQADGELLASISGGVFPFNYYWKETGTTTPTITGLSSGTYTVVVVDKAGCKMEASSFIDQPEPLNLNLTTIPVCFGMQNGSITVNANGGTTPYVYSIDGITFQSTSQFVMGTGSCNVILKDDNGCLAFASTQIVQRNDRPEPNFLVASRRNALDTLVIVDISIPKPDSLSWQFDQYANIVNNNAWSPVLWFADAGTYSVDMTGYFGGCEYTVNKNIIVNPYDPNAVKEKSPGYRPIKSVSVSPNPSSGEFDVEVKLNRKYNLIVVVYDMLGSKHFEQTWSDVEEVGAKINISGPPGVYLLRALTESDAQDERVVISR